MKFKRIKDLREDNDKHQKDIAHLLGISQQYYSEYECGNRTIPIIHLITLAKYYGTSIDYIVGLSDEKIIIKKKKKATLTAAKLLRLPFCDHFLCLCLPL